MKSLRSHSWNDTFLGYLSALHSLVFQIEVSTPKGEYTMRTFVDIEGIFNCAPSKNYLILPKRDHNVDDSLGKWIYAMPTQKLRKAVLKEVRYRTFLVYADRLTTCELQELPPY